MTASRMMKLITIAALAAGIAWLCQQGEALNSVQPGEPITLDMRHQRLIRH